MSRLFPWMTIAWTWSWKRGPWIPCRRNLEIQLGACVTSHLLSNKPDLTTYPIWTIIKHMIPLELFYPDMLGASCIGSAYSFGETQVFILTIGHGRIIFNSLRPNVESKHGDWKWTKKEWPHKSCLLVMMIWKHKWKWVKIVFSTWTVCVIVQHLLFFATRLCKHLFVLLFFQIAS